MAISKWQAHHDFIRSVLIWNDLVFSSSDDGTIQSWDFLGKHRNTIQVQDGFVLQIFVHQDSLFSSTQNFIKRFDWEGNLIQTFPQQIESFCSMDGILYTGQTLKSKGDIVQWKEPFSKQSKSWASSKIIRRICVWNHKFLLSTSEGIRRWDVYGNGNGTWDVFKIPTHGHVFMVTLDMTLILAETDSLWSNLSFYHWSGVLQRKIPQLRDQIWALVLFEDSIISGANFSMKRWDRNGDCLQVVPVNEGKCYCLATDGSIVFGGTTKGDLLAWKRNGFEIGGTESRSKVTMDTSNSSKLPKIDERKNQNIDSPFPERSKERYTQVSQLSFLQATQGRSISYRWSLLFDSNKDLHRIILQNVMA